MRGQSYQQIGVPMNEEVMAGLSLEEQIFWVCFFREAEDVIKQMKALGKEEPFDSPASLRGKYRVALEKYDGRIYCQVRQLEKIFNFNGGDDNSPGCGPQTFLRDMV